MINTQWIAITGAPSSGKTSVIDVLAAAGYATQPEVARELIEQKLASGQTLADIRSPENTRGLQREILARKSALEDTQNPNDIIFMDRGIPDSFAYFRQAGLDTAEVAAAAQKYSYRAVFLFDRLPIKADSVRTEDNAAAQQLEDMFLADYRAIGYDVIRVPVMPIMARTDFILQHLGLPALSSKAGLA
jgi:predicted ATPase